MAACANWRLESSNLFAGEGVATALRRRVSAVRRRVGHCIVAVRTSVGFVFCRLTDNESKRKLILSGKERDILQHVTWMSTYLCTLAASKLIIHIAIYRAARMPPTPRYYWPQDV